MSHVSAASALPVTPALVATWRDEMGELFTPTHMIVLAVVAIVLFGGRKLPELGKGLGEGLRGFKEGMKGVTEEVNKPGETAHTVTPKTEDTVVK
jgi:sec-independent protein translocase protein TatA